MPRSHAVAWLILLFVAVVAVAEATLLGLIVLLSSVLGLSLGVELGPTGFLVARPSCCGPQLDLYNAAVLGSIVLTAGCGAAAAISRFRNWRPL